MPLVGGAVCLDLLNTTGARASGSPRERLLSYDDLLAWSVRAGVLGERDARRLRAAAANRKGESAAALARALRLRELLYGVFRPIAEGGEPPADLLAELSRWWRADRNRRELVWTRSDAGGKLELHLEMDESELDLMLWPIVSSAIELLTSARIARIKRCGECDWLFVDESKNGSRTWCKKECGDRARARRHYQRARRKKKE
jgi:predicted RNA-binding Zn ribbon-like protein